MSENKLSEITLTPSGDERLSGTVVSLDREIHGISGEVVDANFSAEDRLSLNTGTSVTKAIEPVLDTQSVSGGSALPVYSPVHIMETRLAKQIATATDDKKALAELKKAA